MDAEIARDIPVPMRDGIVLSTDVYRPRTDGGHPALLLRIPYDKTLARSYVYAHPIWYARQGWASSWSCRTPVGATGRAGRFIP